MPENTEKKLLEVFLISAIEERIKKLEKRLQKTSQKSGVPVEELKKILKPFAEKAMEEFFGK